VKVVEKEKNEWQWEDEKIDTPEERQGKIEMLEYLILHSYFSSMEDLDNREEGWTKEELEEELDSLESE